MLLPAGSARGAAPKPLEPLSFLLGDWVAGANQGAPGQGAGSCSFTPGLQDQVIVRTNHAEYPASEKSPAVKHDDLMVIYAVGAGAQASYFDNEGHVIHYSVATPGPGQAVFLGDATAGTPRYRLTYRLRPDGVLEGEFEVAPPGKPEAFTRYLAWECRRVAVGGK
jgi:hypothetical protein